MSARRRLRAADLGHYPEYVGNRVLPGYDYGMVTYICAVCGQVWPCPSRQLEREAFGRYETPHVPTREGRDAAGGVLPLLCRQCHDEWPCPAAREAGLS